jgi:voltage-gated potassium channel
VWWATVTITTVGYGDIFPITTAGRVAGVVLMFSGLAVLGVLAGTLATFFGLGDDDATAEANEAGELSTASASSDADLRARLDELERAIAAVRRELG